MSSISSCDSYEIEFEDRDDTYMARLDELEMSHDSESDDQENMMLSFKTKPDENELELLCIYLKCKKSVFNFASRYNKQFADLLCFTSLLLSSSLIFIPFLTSRAYVLCPISIVLLGSLSLSRYYKFDLYKHQYKFVANKYAALHQNVATFLANFVYMTDKQNVFYQKVKEIEEKLNGMKEHNNEFLRLPYSIQLRAPTISKVDIFHCIHTVEIDKRNLGSRYRNVKNDIIDLIATDDVMMRRKHLKDTKRKIKDALKNTNYAYMKQRLENEYKEVLIMYD